MILKKVDITKRAPKTNYVMPILFCTLGYFESKNGPKIYSISGYLHTILYIVNTPILVQTFQN